MKVVNDVVLEFTGKYEVRKEGEIQLAGSNPSAEEADEGTEENVERGVDVVLNHKLQVMDIYTDLKTFKDYIKEYMKKSASRHSSRKRTGSAWRFTRSRHFVSDWRIT